MKELLFCLVAVYHLNFPKVQGCSSDPATNLYPVLVRSSAPVLPLCMCMQFMVLVSKLSDVQFVAGITGTN